VTRPVSGYVSYVRVRFNECDPYGHVNNAVYLSYLEQIAIDHATALGWPAARLQEEIGAVFVARKHEIEYYRPAFEGDILRVRTWPVEMRGARGYRAYDISIANGEPPGTLIDRVLDVDELVDLPRSDILVSARTEWAFMNISTGRPMRVPKLVADGFVSTIQ
jgi:acyl-CoA thioester hydrolase